MAVGKSFFDQYSVFCVFGSVVGCVVVPLITQSVESVIFSAIVISLTATHLTRRNSISEGPGKNAKEEKKKKDNQAMKKRKKAPTQHQQHSPTRQVVETRPRKKRDDGMKKMEELKMLEQERKELEKKERKTKKKEEREIRKEEERVIRERELQKLQNMKEQKDKSKGKQGATNSDKTKSVRSTTQLYPKKQDKAASLSKLDTLLTRPLATDSKLRQRTSSCSDNNDEQLSPPPSVWKIPEYAPPKWNPGQPETTNVHKDEYSKHVPQPHYPLNNDSEHLRPKTKPVQPFNQLYNHTTNMQANFKNQFMNQEVKRFQESFLQHSETSSVNLKESWSKADYDLFKPDNRQFLESSYESPPISELPSVLQFLHADYTKESSAPSSKEYTLFGPEEPNRSIFTPPNLSTFGHV